MAFFRFETDDGRVLSLRDSTWADDGVEASIVLLDGREVLAYGTRTVPYAELEVNDSRSVYERAAREWFASLA